MLLGLYIAGGLLLAVSAVLWWDHRTIDPQRAFWGMVDQSMKTSAVTVESSQGQGDSTLHQTIQYSTGGQNKVHTLTAVTQAGTSIVDEMVGTPTADYTRYTSVKTDQKTASGKPINFDKILGIWSRSDHAYGESDMLQQAVLGTNLPLGGVAVPLAQLNAAQRAKLTSQIQKDGVYSVNYNNVAKTHKDGRLLYTYTVNVKPQQYAAMMKLFGTSTGLHNLDTIKPEQYAGQPEFTLVMTVDVRSHQLLSAETADGTVKQTYSSYDIPTIINEPAKSITTAELQKRLQDLQK